MAIVIETNTGRRIHPTRPVTTLNELTVAHCQGIADELNSLVEEANMGDRYHYEVATHEVAQQVTFNEAFVQAAA